MSEVGIHRRRFQPWSLSSAAGLSPEYRLDLIDDPRPRRISPGVFLRFAGEIFEDFVSLREAALDLLAIALVLGGPGIRGGFGHGKSYTIRFRGQVTLSNSKSPSRSPPISSPRSPARNRCSGTG